MTVQIPVSSEMKNRAREHALERMGFEYDRFKLKDTSRESMVTIGTLGQIAFGEYLQKLEIAHEFEFQAGLFDNFDFKINNDIWEIKTSGYSGSFEKMNLLYSGEQFDRGLRLGYRYCVQQFVNGYDKSSRTLDLSRASVVFIVGAIRFEKISNFKNSKQFLGDDYKVPLSQLTAIETLLNN